MAAYVSILKKLFSRSLYNEALPNVHFKSRSTPAMGFVFFQTFSLNLQCTLTIIFQHDQD